MKTIQFLIITILLTLTTHAALEISIDNASWQDATIYGLEVYEENGTLLLDGLDPDTTYYFRANNDSTNYTYLQTRTQPAEDHMLAIILALIGATAFFIFLATLMPNTGLKLFFNGVALFQILTMFYLIWIDEGGSSIVTALQHNFWVLLIISTGIVITSIALWAISQISLEPDDLKNKNKKWNNR